MPTQRLRSSELRDSMRSIFHRPMKAYGSPDSMGDETLECSGKRPAPSLLDLELSHKRFQPIPVIRAGASSARPSNGEAASSDNNDERGSETRSDAEGSTAGPPKLKRGEREPPKAKRGRPPKSASVRGGLVGQGMSRAAVISKRGRSRDPPVRFSPHNKKKGAAQKDGAARLVGRPPRTAAVVGEQKRELNMLDRKSVV